VPGVGLRPCSEPLWDIGREVFCQSFY
jgi:hypothetical protein